MRLRINLKNNYFAIMINFEKIKQTKVSKPSTSSEVERSNKLLNSQEEGIYLKSVS